MSAEEKQFTATSQIVQNLVATSGFEKRSITALIRDAFDDIEKAKKDGFSYITIEKELNKYGIPVKKGTLKNFVGRIRTERSNKPAKVEPKLPAPVAADEKAEVAKPGAFTKKERTREELLGSSQS